MPHDLVDLVFDGQCGFCTRAAYAIKRFDTKARIRLHPAQRPGVHERFNLTESDTQKAAWAFTHNRRASGAESINLVLDVIFGTHFFTKIYRLPGIHFLQHRAYTGYQDSRYRASDGARRTQATATSGHKQHSAHCVRKVMTRKLTRKVKNPDKPT